jgi:hypothetical protein
MTSSTAGAGRWWADWPAGRPGGRREAVTVTATDAFWGYAGGLAAELPDAAVVDHFHVVKLANQAVDTEL